MMTLHSMILQVVDIEKYVLFMQKKVRGEVSHLKLVKHMWTMIDHVLQVCARFETLKCFIVGNNPQTPLELSPGQH